MDSSGRFLVRWFFGPVVLRGCVVLDRWFFGPVVFGSVGRWFSADGLARCFYFWTGGFSDVFDR